MAEYITKIRTESGDMQIDYRSLANLPDEPTLQSLGAAPAEHDHDVSDIISGILPIAQGGTGATTADDARTHLGAVNKSGDIMTGALTAPLVNVVDTDFPMYEFKQSTNGLQVGSIFLDIPNRRLVLRTYAADMDGASTRYSESYFLPITDTGLTAHKSYSLLTTKSPVSIKNGGTGATTVAEARVNLGAADSQTVDEIGTLLADLRNDFGEYTSAQSDKNTEMQSAVIPTTRGGTGATNGAAGLKNLFAAGNTVLSSYQYGATLPSAGTKGRIFFKKVSG